VSMVLVSVKVQLPFFFFKIVKGVKSWEFKRLAKSIVVMFAVMKLLFLRLAGARLFVVGKTWN